MQLVCHMLLALVTEHFSLVISLNTQSTNHLML